MIWVFKVAAVGGAESLLLNTARFLDHDRFDVTCVFIQNRDDIFVAELESAGLQCVDLSTRRGGLMGSLVALIRFVCGGRWDIIHVHSPLPGVFARIASLCHSRHRPVLITTEHSTWDSYHPLTRVVNALTMRLDNAVLAVSQETYLSLSPAIRAKAHVATQGVAIEELRAEGAIGRASLRWRCPPGTPVLVTVANLRDEKDHLTLLRAYRHLLDRHVMFHAILVGEGLCRDEITREISLLRLEQHVELLGARKDVPQVLAASDVFVLSSVREGMPVAIMEALAIGLPIVATAVGGIPQALKGTGAAFLVASGDSEGLACQLQLLLEDEQLRLTMAAAAKNAAEKFGLTRVVEQLENQYLSLAT